MKRQLRQVLYGHLVTAGVALITVVAPVSAQTAAGETTPAPQQLTASTDQSAPQTPIRSVQPVQIRQPHWSSTGGFETDTHDTGYGFFGPTYIKPIQHNLAVVAGANVNYLYYQYPSGSGQTSVKAPGVSARGGVQFGEKNTLTLSAGPMFKRRHTEIMDGASNVIRKVNDTLVGVDFGADLWVDPTSHNNIFGMLDYNTLDSYKWSRLAYKEQLANHNWSGRFTPYLGAEVVAQGNKDIRSTQVGAFIEIVHVPSTMSIMLRGGYKRSAFAIGPAQTGPWVAIGFYRRLR
jgi:hypothetical protein